MATKRLIDANALLEAYWEEQKKPGTYSVAKMIVEAPTVDAVEVVRCKDCKHWNNKGCGEGCGWCEAWDGGRFHDNFCSYGERKENG